MIKFFRKIRQNLLMENKTGKYLKYAIGEIVLVMVGILLALQVNNWNQNQKLDTLTQDYLHLLLTDLEEDSLNLSDRISWAEERITEYENYVAAFDSTEMTGMEISTGLQGISGETNTLTYKTNTIEVLKSTGDIKLIPEEIRNKIIDLNRSQEYLDFIIKRNLGVFVGQQQELGKLGWSESALRLWQNARMAELALKHMFHEEKFTELIYAVESVYHFKYGTETMIKEKYEEQLLEISEIRTMIKLELD